MSGKNPVKFAALATKFTRRVALNWNKTTTLITEIVGTSSTTITLAATSTSSLMLLLVL